MANGSAPAPKVVLLHNYLTPYRVPLFAELATRFDLDVWFLGNVRSIRDWPEDAPDAGFRYRHLRRLELPLGSRYNSLILNYALPVDLRCGGHDVIMCWGWDSPAAFYAACHACFAKTPFVIISESTPVEQSLLRTLTRPAVRALVRAGDAWVASGSRARQYFEDLGADPERVFCAYNAVAQEFFARGASMTDYERCTLRRKLGIETPYAALYCGNLLDLKGVADLLPAFAEFARDRRDVTLVLVGSGRDGAKYRAYCESAGLGSRTIFAGFVPPTELPPFYGIADLLILPSRSEVWGLVINEAMACGVPVLTTEAVGAAPDMIQDGVNGYVVPSRDPAALCAALRRHFSGQTDRATMAEAARAASALFTFARMADAFEAAVQCALERRNA